MADKHIRDDGGEVTLCDVCEPYYGMVPPKPWAFRFNSDGVAMCRKHFERWQTEQLAAVTAGVEASNERGVIQRPLCSNANADAAASRSPPADAHSTAATRA